MVDADTVGLLKATIHKLNPDARIITSEFGRVKSDEILNTGLFDFEEAQNSAGWQKNWNQTAILRKQKNMASDLSFSVTRNHSTRNVSGIT